MVMDKYLLGLDAGNTVIKAVIFDLHGNEVARTGEEGHSRKPKAGYVERDLDELWTNSKQVIRRTLEKANIAASDILAIGCAGHGNGLYALDHADQPLIGIQSLDTRATELVAEWQDAQLGLKTTAICGQAPWASQTPTLLSWLKRHDPELFGQIGTAFFVKDFINYRLTDQISSDLSDLSGAGLISLATRSYDDVLLAHYGLSENRAIFPSLVESAEIVGRITERAAVDTGLVSGTPVVGGLFDVVASALGSGVSDTGKASIIVGTWSINQVVVETPKLSKPVFMFSTFDHERFLAMDNSATSAVNLEWLVTNLFPLPDHTEGSAFDACCALAEAIEPHIGDPLYHPFLYGNANDGFARASFLGIAGWHGAGHLVRAVLEGVAFGHRQHVETIRAAGANFDTVSLSGGGSRSQFWPQIFADVLQIPISIGHSQETGALGAAIAAGTGIGVFKNFAAGVEAMVRIERNYLPNRERAAFYDQRYALYLSSEEAMRPLWKGLRAQTPDARKEKLHETL
jgi:L-xylulokinase